jgi:hypothetical protein
VAAEENVAPIFILPGAAFAFFMIKDVLGVEVRPRAQVIFEVKPSKDLHLVMHTRTPDVLPVQVNVPAAVLQSIVGVSGSVSFTRQLH